MLLFSWWLTLAPYLTRCFYLYHKWCSERKKIKSSSVCEGVYLKIWGENFENSEIQLTLDNLNTHKIELHRNPCWIHSRNPVLHLSLLSKTYRNSHLITLIVLTIIIFYTNNNLVPLQILSCRDPTVAPPISP